MTKIIEAVGLTKKYQDGDSTVFALQNVSLKLPEGESMVIIGPSGSGKTTLLQLLGGLEYPSEGTVKVHDKTLNAMDDGSLSAFRNSTIGFVFQFFQLHEYLTAKENIALPLMLAGKGGQEANTRADELLKDMHLEDRSRHIPVQMSGGEMQRVAIARALANHPKIILADEPTGNLDKKNAENVLEIFSHIMKSGVSVVMITHDEGMSKRFTRSLHLDKGKLIS